ncbi:MAG TPA: MBL fold metallo-hydrolase [Steroidobacteraceae bacterium]|nr:MBL fold metallo-hydrolase [Steroidobacteraceae bacterium]
MKRRDVLATALTASPWLFAGCVSTAPRLAGMPAGSEATRVTVLYDAFGRETGLQRDWGYAAFVETAGKRILFDTGNNAEVLAQNTRAKGIDLSRLDFVVMSHRHGDHMGGMSYLLAQNPKVRIYAPKEGFGVYGADLPSAFYRKDPSLAPEQRYYNGAPPDKMVFGSAWPQANLTLIDKTTQIAPGLHLISLVSDKPGTLELREQSLAIETPEGILLVVGCSHPGIDNIVKAAAAINPDIRFVVGGFHLVVAKDPEIEAVAIALHETYKVGYIAPGHCTGEPTFAALKKAFGDRYLYAGLGTTFEMGATPKALSAGHRSGQPTEQEAGSDVLAYRALLGASNDRRSRLFGTVQRSTSPDGAYLAQWRKSMAGCC